jgi:hypothetical protein
MAAKDEGCGCVLAAIIGILYGVGWCLLQLARNMESVSRILGQQLSGLADLLAGLGDWSAIATMSIALLLWLTLLAPTQALLLSRATKWGDAARCVFWVLLALCDGVALMLTARAANYVEAFARWPIVGAEWSKDLRIFATVAVFVAGVLTWYGIFAMFMRGGRLAGAHDGFLPMKIVTDVFVRMPVFVAIGFLFNESHAWSSRADDFEGRFGLLVARGFVVAGCGAYALTMWIARRQMARATPAVM